MEIDLYKDPLGKDKNGKDIYLKDIWPSNKEIETTLADSLNANMFIKRYSNVSEGPVQWQKIKTEKTSIYNWDESSTYVKRPPFFDQLSDEPEGFKEIKDARPLLILGDMVTTDHISPAGSIQKESPTGEYFMKHQVLPKDYNSIAPAKMSLIQWKRHNPSKVLVMFQHTHAGLTFNRNKDSFEDSHIILKSNDVLLGQWTEIIFNTNWHPDEDKGFMKVWIDGILKIDFKGTSNTSKGEELNLRYGLYASAISRYKKAFNTEIIPQRIVYFDGVNAESKCEKLLDKAKCNNLTSQTIEKYELFMYDKNDIKFHNHSVVKLPINFLK